ncbi:MAG: FtsK/SpoIIIE domain-containing protein, partial [Pseudonocardiaceae bacterium]
MVQVVVQRASGEVEVEVAVRQPQATVGDLAVALRAAGNGANSVLVIGGRPVQAQLPLAQAGLHQGAVVRLPGATGGAAGPGLAPGPSSNGHRSDLALVITGGVVAGPSWPLARGSSVSVGRDPSNGVVIDHPTVSSRHCAVYVDGEGQVTLADLGSHNGTWVDGVPVRESHPVAVGDTVRIGAVFLAVVRPAAVDRLPDATPRPGAGTVALNRPPRAAVPREPEPLEALAAPPQPPSRMPLSIVAILAPLLFAGVMVIALHQAYYAVFALLSPVMAIGTWLESRRRARKTAGTGSQQFATELAALRAALEDRVRAETERRRTTLPHPAELLRWAGAPSTRLWERRAHHADFLQLHGGIGTLPWLPTITGGSGKPPPQVEEILTAEGVLRDVPIPVDLAAGRVVGVVGDRAAALALARALLLQATTLSGPADLRVAILTDPDRVDDWEWAKWLPHTADAASRRLACDAEANNALLRELLAAGASNSAQAGVTEPMGPVTLVVLDAESLTAGPNAPARAVLRGEGALVAGLVVSEARHLLPAMCTTVIEIRGGHGEARLSRPEQGEVVEQFVVAGVGKPVALRWARALTRFEDPELIETGAGLSDVVNLVPLLAADPFDPRSVATQWRRQGSVLTPIGVTTDGALRIDLVADGPHGLVVGAAGSGKSELLRTAIAGLATAADPDHVTFLLVDPRGNRALDPCARLPHTVGLISGLDEPAGEKLLQILDAELRRRERALRADRRDPLPRLLIAIDDFEVAAELSKFLSSLGDLAQRADGLGIHLLLATQRMSSVVNTFTTSIKANLRLALRTSSDTDSANAIGTNAAASIPLDRPGRGFARVGISKPAVFQAAQVRGATATPDTAVDVRPFQFCAQRRRGEDAQNTNGDPTAGFTRLVTTVEAAFAASGLQRPRQLWSGDAPTEAPLETVELLGLLGIHDVETITPATLWHPAA